MRNIKQFISLLIWMLIIVPGFSMQTEIRDLATFNVLDASGSFDVILEKGSKTEVRVESEKIAPENIITAVENNTLKVYLKRNSTSWSYTGRIVVYVSYQNLEAIKSSGSGDVKCTSVIEGNNFRLNNSGSGDVWLKNIRIKSKLNVSNSGSGDVHIERAECDDFYASLSGSGDLKIATGNTEKASFSTNGSGDVSAIGLLAKTVTANTSGSGDVSVFASENLDAKISGSGDITYKGSASNVSKRKTGSGDVYKK